MRHIPALLPGPRREPFFWATADVVFPSRSAYTASLSSSVVDYPVENGRRYHAYRKGGESREPPETWNEPLTNLYRPAYLLPNDDVR